MKAYKGYAGRDRLQGIYAEGIRRRKAAQGMKAYKGYAGGIWLHGMYAEGIRRRSVAGYQA